MNLSKIKEKIIRKKIEKQLTLNLSKPVKYKKKERIKTIGILATTSTIFEIENLVDKYNYQEYFAKKLSINLDNIKLLFFSEYDKKTQESNYDHFTKKDVGWKANFTKQEVLDFIKKPFDLLIDFSNTKNSYLSLILQQSKADLKAGFAGNDDRILDIIINVKEQDIEGFNEELLKCLKNLKKI